MSIAQSSDTYWLKIVHGNVEGVDDCQEKFARKSSRYIFHEQIKNKSL